MTLRDLIRVDRTILMILKVSEKALKALNLILILGRSLILDSKPLEIKRLERM